VRCEACCCSNRAAEIISSNRAKKIKIDNNVLLKSLYQQDTKESKKARKQENKQTNKQQQAGASNKVRAMLEEKATWEIHYCNITSTILHTSCHVYL
jgi:hypothetical protein